MYNEELRPSRPIRWAMVGGGRGSEIGYAHRSAAIRDGSFELVAGAFDIDAEACVSFGVNLGVQEQRCYSDYVTMFAKEAQRDDGIEAVSIATPNATHYAISKAALEAGLHVVCEKPLTFTMAEAEELEQLSRRKRLLLGVTYGYSGFPMIHQARAMVRNGDLGKIRIVNMQFAHGFHSAPVDGAGAKWRMNPSTSGPSYVLGDTGTHAFYLGQMIAELEVERLLCTRQSFVPGREPLEDNANVLLKFKGGAVGNLWASAVNAGSMHQQKIRVIGEKASLEWWDEYPNQLRFEQQGKPAQILERGMDYLYLDDKGVNDFRVGGGHAEGFFDAWANIYRRFANVIEHLHSGNDSAVSQLWYPDAQAGVEGVRFIERCIESVDNGETWVDYT
ncbi:MAG: Gfo/Idh/MocA family protein [Arenicella sp.]